MQNLGFGTIADCYTFDIGDLVPVRKSRKISIPAGIRACDFTFSNNWKPVYYASIAKFNLITWWRVPSASWNVHFMH